MIAIYESKDELRVFLSRLRFNFMYEEFYDSFFSRFFFRKPLSYQLRNEESKLFNWFDEKEERTEESSVVRKQISIKFFA